MVRPARHPRHFSSTPYGYEWLDDVAQRVDDHILTHRDTENIVAGRADWYAGNTVVADLLPTLRQ